MEYVAHTRDAIAWYGERIDLILTQDRPQLAARDWDAVCEERRYVDEVPAQAVEGVEREASRLAAQLAATPADNWKRAGVGSGGDDRTVLDLARRAVHEGVHHLLDVQRVLQAVMTVR